MGFFDPLSFVLGMGTAGAIGGGAYLLRNRVKFVKKEAGEDAESSATASAREFLAPQASKRYLEAMGKFFERQHLLGQQAALQDVLIEPQFLKTKLPKLDGDEEEDNLAETNIYRVIPFIHHSPAVYASFNLETMRLQDLETGSRQVAILGVVGSGKTTVLMALGLIATGRLSYEVMRKDEEAHFEADKGDEDAPAEIRERRQKEREEVQRRAIEQLRIVQKRETQSEALDKLDLSVDFAKLFPLYIHIRDVDLNPENYGGSIDPAEPIARALSGYVDGVTAQVTPPVMYKMLRDHRAMILIDGYDELLPSEQEGYYHWLEALVNFYGENFIFITAPARGYDPLMQLGFAPAVIRPYTERRFERFIGKYLAQNPLPDSERLLVDNRNRLMIDVTIKLLAQDIQQTGRRGYYDAYIRQQLGEALLFAQPILQKTAAYWLDNGKAISAEDFKSLFEAVRGQEEQSGEETDKKKKAKPVSNVDRDIKKLLQTVLFREQPDGSLAFKYPMVAWYLAGETLKEADKSRLEALATQPNWHGALTFATAFVDLEPTVLKKVLDPNQFDLVLSNLFSVADWMADAPRKLRWKEEIIKRLGAALNSPAQYPTVREHALAAMVASRDDSGGVVYLLRQAVRSGNAHIRALGCLGIGAVGVEGAIGDLASMLQDPVVDVQLAAGLGLGAIATEDALTPLVQALLSGTPALRQAVAEAMASMPGDGHEILYDGITHEDLEVRRACAFGLARIPTTWALVGLYRAMLEDSQWYVRSAAERAFAQAREPKSAGPQPLIEPNRYPWLEKWASGRGEVVPEGHPGRQVLMRALQEGPQQVRTEAARALGYLAHTPAIKALYAALGDREQTVRVAAFDALGDIAARYGKPLPSV